MNKEKYTIINKILHINKDFEQEEYICFYLPNTKMDFLLRKIFKASEIEYFYDRSRRSITVNSNDSPFRLNFMIAEYGYIKVRRIPIDEFEFLFFARDPADLFRKMVDKNIITVRQFRKVIQSQKQERAIKRQALKFLVRKK